MPAENERSTVNNVLENHLGPWLFFAAVSFLIGSWVLADNSIPKEHSGRTLLDTWALFNWFKHGGRAPLNGYPPFCNMIACLAYALNGGFSAKAAILSQLIFLLPMGYGVFYIGRKLGGLWGGALALLSVSGNLWLHIYARGYFLEVGESALLICIIAAFISCDNFRLLKPSLLFGLFLGIGMLVKWAILFYLFLILAYAAIKVFFFDRSGPSADSQPSTKRVFLYSMGLAALICGWWYAAAFFELINKSGRDVSQAYYSGGEIFMPLFAALGNGYWLAFVWFGIGCFAHIKYKSERSPFIVYCSLAMLAAMLIIYTVMGVPVVNRYVLPGSLLIGIVGFSSAGKINNTYIKTAICAAVLFINLIQLNLGGIVFGYQINEGLSTKCNTYISHLDKIDKNKNSADRELRNFADGILAAIVSKLRESHECRFTAVTVRGRNVSLDADMFILRALEIYDLPIDIDIYVPGHYEFEPKTSLLLFLSPEDEAYLRDKNLKGYQKIGSWENSFVKQYASLYKNRAKRDSKAAMPSLAR
ncbi:hypothetical protein IJT93_11990 [bacterium]|nr:hypothetical protein [bacterium]